MGMGGSCLEGEPARESTARLTTSEWVAASRGEAAATAAIHHVEQDVGVDVDVGAVHAAHASHATHTAHAAHASHAAEATAAEHVSRVHQVITVVISSTLPEVDVSVCVKNVVYK